MSQKFLCSRQSQYLAKETVANISVWYSGCILQVSQKNGHNGLSFDDNISFIGWQYIDIGVYNMNLWSISIKNVSSYLCECEIDLDVCWKIGKWI